jgi:hypothetical protein
VPARSCSPTVKARRVDPQSGRLLEVMTIPMRLLGLVDQEESFARLEDDYPCSRDAARLALAAFWDQPIRGIGWERFPEYVPPHSDRGALASHDEYLRIAAELGLVGLLLSAGGGPAGGRAAPDAAGSAAGSGDRRAGRRGCRAAVRQQLATPGVALPIFLLAGIAASRLTADRP